MRDFAKDIENIRKIVVHEYDKERNIILKDLKVHKKKKPAWNSDYRFYGTLDNNVDEYSGVIEQLSPEILNKLDIANKRMIDLAKKEFANYFDKYFHNFVSIKNIKVDFTTQTEYTWPSFTYKYKDKKVFCFFIKDEEYSKSESKFAEYLQEKYYYINTLNKINNICNPLELVMNR